MVAPRKPGKVRSMFKVDKGASTASAAGIGLAKRQLAKGYTVADTPAYKARANTTIYKTPASMKKYPAVDPRYPAADPRYPASGRVKTSSGPKTRKKK